jgi:uncharacterized DUF497 family protein
MLFVRTIVLCTNIPFDPAEAAANLAKHGVSLSKAANLERDEESVWVDARQDYGAPHH